uniref:Double zinc ribbon and ankyrin repeat-containing protein 1 n=1 Tax=Lates calcarifer TaxID=8187 RepID=A0A4W6E0S7_LATCA
MTAGAVSAPLIIPIVLQTHRAKNHIDTNTPVSIQSDTPGVLIFYTLDGSKPVAVQRGSAGSSRKYSEPILLPAGRVSVRAVAVSSDGRQSSTVTKVFSVELTDSHSRKEIEENFLFDDQQVINQTCDWLLTALMSSTHRSVSAADICGSPQTYFSVSPVSPIYLSHLSVCQSYLSHLSVCLTCLCRCAQCLSFRPSDPFARFCAQCGAVVPPLPEQRLPPAEGGQTVLCVFCNAVVPVNTHTCLICDASVQLRPQARLTLQDHVVCVTCGSGNPAHVSTCLTCESRLQPQVCVGNSAPCVPSADGRMLSCSRCKRINHSDARYCDWCGSKPGHAASCVTCWQCGASGHPYAFYCTACGVYLEAPAPPTSCSDITRPVRIAPPTVDQCTQTVGLYYPSATELHKKDQQRARQLSRQQATRDRQPLLTAISPGRGYWRKQLDHVCAHLRSYTQNNASFRTLLGEPHLGRMVSAVIREDGYEVSLTISFVSARREEKQVKDIQLLKELGPGRGQISVIQQLLDQGADPSCCGSDGRHALAVAVVNSHRDVLPVLVQRGADVDQQSGRMKNSALHEAAALGSEGLQCAEVLLSCRASVRRRNAAGQTAYDVAVSSGSNDMVSLLAARTGLDLLGKLGKPKLNLDVF